jgi:hypothetical protein
LIQVDLIRRNKQFKTVLMLDNSPDDGTLSLSGVQVHFDFVADLELARTSMYV